MQWALTEHVKTSAGTVAAGHTGQGPALVLAHGWPWSSYTWHRVIPTLAQAYRVFWFDMPGYGASEKVETQATGLDVQGIILTEMFSHWQLERPSVIAHDMGGAVALRAHLLHEHEFERLALMNIVAMRPWGSEFFDHVRRHVDAFQGLPPHIHTAIVEAYVKGALTRDIAPRDFEALVAPWLTPEGALSFYRQFEQADEAFTAAFEPSLPAMRCPVHIIWGEDDPWIPLARGKALYAAIGDAVFTTLPGVAHLPQLEEPAAVLKALQGFLPGL